MLVLLSIGEYFSSLSFLFIKVDKVIQCDQTSHDVRNWILPVILFPGLYVVGTMKFYEYSLLIICLYKMWDNMKIFV